MRKLISVVLLLMVQSCTVTFVQPYDEKLVESTEAFYKETALAIEKAREKSPINRNVPAGTKPNENVGHISKYKAFYSNAKIAANGLIIRAMVNTEKVDQIAVNVHTQIEDVISKSLPSNCAGDTAQITGEITLTLQNFLDLKCLITHWETQHNNAPNSILKKSNWESRQISLMGMIISIQKAEAFKTTATVN